jgi:hypothetical protein
LEVDAAKADARHPNDLIDHTYGIDEPITFEILQQKLASLNSKAIVVKCDSSCLDE